MLAVKFSIFSKYEKRQETKSLKTSLKWKNYLEHSRTHCSPWCSSTGLKVHHGRVDQSRVPSSHLTQPSSPSDSDSNGT